MNNLFQIMTSLIFGVGIGTSLIATLILLSFVTCCISSRTRSNIGPVFTASSVLLTALLLVIPRDSGNTDTDLLKVQDPHFLWRSFVIFFLGLSLIGGCVFFFIDHVMEPRLAKSLRA